MEDTEQYRKCVITAVLRQSEKNNIGLRGVDVAKPVMISVSGIRGIVGHGLSPELMVKYSAAAGTFYGGGKVLVGRDSRVTGNMVKHAVFSGLMSVGCNPVDLGICSTPTVEHAVKVSDAVGGIIITASHNPAEWNALKLLNKDGVFLDEAAGEELRKIIAGNKAAYKEWDRVGRLASYSNATTDHIGAILSMDVIDAELIRSKKFTVAVDCVNGAGGTVVPRLLESLGCTVHAIHADPTGVFAHTPEPVPENLKDLCDAVKESGADIGFAVDPDVDRCAVVDETAKPVGEEYTVVLSAKYILEKRKGPVVVNVSTTRAVDDVAREAGVEVFRTKVGEIHVVTKMLDVMASVGGEGNGGLILPDIHLGRDAPMAVAVILQMLAEKGSTISELAGQVPSYTMVKKRIEIGGADPDAVLEMVKNTCDASKLNLVDGVKIEEKNHWVQVRKSNTEPILRIMAEAETKERAEAVCDDMMALISKNFQA